MISPLVPVLQGGPSAQGRPWIVPRLPGYAHHYLHPTLAGWPDEVGGVDGVHTGSPSLASDPDGVVYDGSTQFTTVGNAATFASWHQGDPFSQILWFSWAGPAGASALECVAGNALGATTKGSSAFIDDGGGGLGPRMFSAQLARGQLGVINRLNTDPNAVIVDQIHCAIITSDGVTLRLLWDGVEVDSQALIAAATGNSSYAYRIGDTEVATPAFRLNGTVHEVVIGTEDWSAYAAQIYADGPGGFG